MRAGATCELTDERKWHYEYNNETTVTVCSRFGSDSSVLPGWPTHHRGNDDYADWLDLRPYGACFQQKVKYGSMMKHESHQIANGAARVSTLRFYGETTPFAFVREFSTD
jgi:hypothetical protein